MKIDLKTIEIYNIIVGLAVSIGAYFIFNDKMVAPSIFAGVIIGGLNFFGLYFIFSRLLAEGDGPKMIFGILAFIKFVVLIFLLWAAIRLLHLNVVALLAELSIVIVILCTISIYSSGLAKR